MGRYSNDIPDNFRPDGVGPMQFAKSLVFAVVTTAVLSGSALGAVVASAVTPLNLRSGPGPEYPVIGAIPANGKATITGCIQGSLWCQVTFGGKQGWAYSQYLTATLSGRSLAVSESIAQFPTVAYEVPPATVGAGPRPAVTGTLIAPLTTTAPLLIEPPTTVREYVNAHPVQPAYLNGEVVVGSGLPSEVALMPVPGYQYQYAYVNGVPVLVEPQTREVRYIYQ
jgi:uncharacterized protein YraI